MFYPHIPKDKLELIQEQGKGGYRQNLPSYKMGLYFQNGLR